MSAKPIMIHCSGCRQDFPLGPETRLYQFPDGVPSAYVRVCVCGTSTHVEVPDAKLFKLQLEEANNMVNVIEISDPLPT